MKSHVLADMIWPEVAAAREEINLALLPVGSAEQHGPNMTFQTDSTRAYEIGKRLAERLAPSAIVLPPVTYGISYHHMAFPGTVTLRPETLIAVILDVAVSLKHHGITRLLLVNGHGGNKATLSIAVTKLRHELGMTVAWIGCLSDWAKDFIAENTIKEVIGHADEFECSQAMDLCPWIVRTGALAPGDYVPGRDKKPTWWENTPDGFDKITRNGALGDATRANLEMGKYLSSLTLDRAEKFVRSYFLMGEGTDGSTEVSEFTSS